MGDIFGSREGCLVVLLSLISLSLNKEGFNWTSGPLVANLFEVFKIECSHTKESKDAMKKLFISYLNCSSKFLFGVLFSRSFHWLNVIISISCTVFIILFIQLIVFLKFLLSVLHQVTKPEVFICQGAYSFLNWIRFSVNITDKKQLVSVPKLTL